MYLEKDNSTSNISNIILSTVKGLCGYSECWFTLASSFFSTWYVELGQ